MGCDIHWIIERRHQDGAWEACASKSHEFVLAEQAGNFNQFYQTPQSAFAGRDYTWFGLLSGVRSGPHEAVGKIATEGLPADASEHSTMALSSEWYHSQGHFKLSDITDARRKILQSGTPASSEVILSIDHYRQCAEQVIDGAGPCPVQLDKIIFGPAENDQGCFPDMENESNHHRLNRIERTKGLMPISNDTLRFIIAYDS